MLIFDPNENRHASELLEGMDTCKVLIIDPVDTDRFQLKKILLDMEYKIVSIRPVDNISSVLVKENPELVFFNICYSMESDYHLLEEIKNHKDAHGRTPYIILTLSIDNQKFINCPDETGFFDDVCQKPYQESIIRSKLNTWKKITGMQRMLDLQINRLREYSSKTGQDIELAANIINNLVQARYINPGNIKYVTFPMEVLSGDIFLTAFNAAGHQVFLIGDFTGHGLAPAVEAMVVYDVFYSMVKKGFPLAPIAMEINSKLQRIQSTGRLMRMCMIELDYKNNFVHVLNAGLPDILLKGKAPGVKYRYRSDNLPLGVVPTSELEPNITHSEYEQGDRIYAFTDGLIEIKNGKDKYMVPEFIQEKFRTCRNETGLFQEILEGMHRFHGAGRQTDDITLVEITCDENLVRRNHIRNGRKKHKPPMQWSLSLDMGCDFLKRENPLPQLVQLITELQDLDEHREQIYTILSEMFSNALEHGILGLDSRVKKDPVSFTRYYDQRERLLEEMEQGKLQFEISNRVVKEGARLTLALQHNGNGFDSRQYLDRIQADPEQVQGRGLFLMRNLCSDIRYSNNGRRLELDYTWSHRTDEHDDRNKP